MLRISNEWRDCIQDNFRFPGYFELNILKQNIHIDTVATSCQGQHKMSYDFSKAPLNEWVETDRIASLEDYWWLLDGSFAGAVDNMDQDSFISLNKKAVEFPFRQSVLFKPKESSYRFWCSFTSKNNILTHIDSTTDLLPVDIDDIYIIFDNVRYTGPSDATMTVYYTEASGNVIPYTYSIPESWTYSLSKEEQLLANPNATGISGLYINWSTWSDVNMRPKLTTVALGGLVEPEEGWNVTQAKVTKEASYLDNGLPNFTMEVSIDNTHRNIDPTLRKGVAKDLKIGSTVTTRWGQQFDSSGVMLYMPWETWVIESVEVPPDYTNVTLHLVPKAQYYCNDVINGFLHHQGLGMSLMEKLVCFTSMHIENFIENHGGQYFNKTPKVPIRGMKYTAWTDGPDRSKGFLNTLMYIAMSGASTLSLDTLSGMPRLVPILNRVEPFEVHDNVVLQLTNIDTQDSIDSIVFKGVELSQNESSEETNARIKLTESMVRKRQFIGSSDPYGYEVFEVGEWQNIIFPNIAMSGASYQYSKFMSGWSALLLEHQYFDYTDSSNVGNAIDLKVKGDFIASSNEFSNISTTKFDIVDDTVFMENPCMGVFVTPPVQSPLQGDQTIFLEQSVRVSSILSQVTQNKYIVTFTYTGRPEVEPFDLVRVIIPEIDENVPQEVIVLSSELTFNGGYNGTLKGLVITKWN